MARKGKVYASVDNLKSNLPLFRLLKLLTKKEQVDLIPHLNDKSQEAIYSMLCNCIRNQGFSKKKVNKLRCQFKKCQKQLLHLKDLGDDLSRSEMTKELQQLGGFPIAGLLASVGIPLVVDLIKRAAT